MRKSVIKGGDLQSKQIILSPNLLRSQNDLVGFKFLVSSTCHAVGTDGWA